MIAYRRRPSVLGATAMPSLPAVLFRQPLQATADHVNPPSVDLMMSEVALTRNRRSPSRLVNRRVHRAGVVGVGAHVDHAESCRRWHIPSSRSYRRPRYGRCRDYQCSPTSEADARGCRSRANSTHHDDVRIPRIDDDRLNIGNVLKADVGPGHSRSPERKFPGVASARPCPRRPREFDGATVSAPIEATRSWSEIGRQTRPPSVVFHTPPPGVPK